MCVWNGPSCEVCAYYREVEAEAKEERARKDREWSKEMQRQANELFRNVKS